MNFSNFSFGDEPTIKTQPRDDSDSFVDNDLHEMRKKIESRKHKQKKASIVFSGLIAANVVLGTALLYSQYKLYKVAQTESSFSSSGVSLQTGEDVIKALAKHILLPEGTPQIAEVKDVEKLRETQAFFKDSKNGDIVVLYTTTIFIYRPSLDIVVASGDVSGVGQTKP